MFKSKDQIIEGLSSSLVRSYGITDLDERISHVRFSYKGKVYGLDVNGGAYLCEGNNLWGSEEAMLFRALVRHALAEKDVTPYI